MMQFINVLIQQLVFPSKFIQEPHKESLKKRFYDHNMSFKNESKKNDTTLAKYIWDLKLKYNVAPTLKQHISRSVTPYSKLTKKCRLCFQEKLEIHSYPNPDDLLNKGSELVSYYGMLNIISIFSAKEIVKHQYSPNERRNMWNLQL